MLQTARPQAALRRTVRPGVVPLAIVTALIIGSLVYQLASSSAHGIDEVGPPASTTALPQRPPSPARALGRFPGVGPATATAEYDAVTEDDGALPDGVTVLNETYPGITKLDPDLLQSLRQAATGAATDGIKLDVNSGWRSADYQDQLLRDAVAEYGSEREAARWVATAETSPHVSGDAVDIGSAGATAWLAKHGARYGLCQIYRNEPWHFELRPDATEGRCPRMFADPTKDPRMWD